MNRPIGNPRQLVRWETALDIGVNLGSRSAVCALALCQRLKRLDGHRVRWIIADPSENYLSPQRSYNLAILFVVPNPNGELDGVTLFTCAHDPSSDREIGIARIATPIASRRAPEFSNLDTSQSRTWASLNQATPERALFSLQHGIWRHLDCWPALRDRCKRGLHIQPIARRPSASRIEQRPHTHPRSRKELFERFLQRPYRPYLAESRKWQPTGNRRLLV